MNKPEQLAIGLKCRVCNKGKYKEVTIDLPYKDIVMPQVKALQCDNCRELFFTLEHHEAIRQRLRAIAPPLEFARAISSAGNMETVNIPKDIVKFLRLKVGTPIRIYVEGKRRIVIEPKEDEGSIQRPLPKINVGKVAGKKKYKRIISELDQLRKGLWT